MLLKHLLRWLDYTSTNGALYKEISSVSHDSRRVDSNSIFVAVRGAKMDGRTFAKDLDVAAVVADAPVETLPHVTTITVPNARAALGQLAAALNNFPVRRNNHVSQLCVRM